MSDKVKHSIRIRVDEESLGILNELEYRYGRKKSDIFKAFIKRTKADLDEERKNEDNLQRRLRDIDSIRELVLKGEEANVIKEQIRYIYNVFR